MALKVLMLTNTYLPHVGGVARSVQSFAEALRERGHAVRVVAPTFDGMPRGEKHVLRVPAIQRFNGSDFSVRLPVPGLLSSTVDEFEPDVVHAHHPFLLGDTALRLARWRNLPLVFTHHTMYEQYTHYVPGDSPALRQFAVRLATDYANLCDHVIAPSESIRDILVRRGVVPPITVIPTGIDASRFGHGDGAAARAQHHIPPDARVVGHVGRLAPEKNLELLARVVAQLVAEPAERTGETGEAGVHALFVGSGPSATAIRQQFAAHGVADRLHLTGSLSGQALVDCYHAMDLFAFASTSETQGMVLAEAMTAGVPVVAVDAPGAREVVVDGTTGRLLPDTSEAGLLDALRELIALDPAARDRVGAAARERAEAFSLPRCAATLASLYERITEADRLADRDDNAWSRTLRMVETEWNLWNHRTEAAWQSLRERT